MFDIGTVVVSITDVLTDVTVILSYHSRGFMTFFWLSSGVLFISSLVFSIMFVGIFLQDRCNLFQNLKDDYKLSKTTNLLLHFLVAAVLSPFGQTFPVIIWAAETFYPHQHRANAAAGAVTLEDGRLELKKPLSDAEIEDMIERHGLMGDAAAELRERNLKMRWEQGDQLREYLKKQMLKHAPFVGEAITESVPQSLIQLVALIVIGQMVAGEDDADGSVDWLSVLSIILSIVSIISKSYIVSISMVRSIFTFKMLAITYDTIALFYIFSSLFLGDSSDPGAIEVPILNRALDPLSAIWLYGMVFITVWLYFVWLIFGFDISYTDWEKRIKTANSRAAVRSITIEHAVMSIGFLAIGTVLWLPLMVVLTACNVSFVLVALKNLEEPFNEDYFPLYSRVLRLFASGEDLKTKIQAYNCVAIECQYESAHGSRPEYTATHLKAQWLPDQRKLLSHTTNDPKAREMLFALNLPTFHLSNLRIANNSSLNSIVNGVAKEMDPPTTASNHYSQSTTNASSFQYRASLEALTNDSTPCSCCHSPECMARKIRARIFCRRARIFVSQAMFVVTMLLYFLASLSTLLYPPVSFVMILSQRLGSAEASWDGVRTFQTILFCMSVVLLSMLIWKAFTVLPWYIKCLWHMTPISRGITNVARAVNKSSMDKATVLDHVFRRVVTTYSARSGRPELDVYAEVNEHDENSDGVCTAYCMECLFLIGRAA